MHAHPPSVYRFVGDPRASSSQGNLDINAVLDYVPQKVTGLMNQRLCRPFEVKQLKLKKPCSL